MSRASRSIFAGLVRWSIVLTVVLVAVLGIMADRTVATMAQERLERGVDTDLAGLADIYATGGEAELAARIGDRLDLIAHEGPRPHYRFAREDGTMLAGDVSQRPALRAYRSATGMITLADGTPAFGRATLLAPDLHLLVARETGDALPLRRRLAVLFVIGGLIAALAVGLLGRIGARRLERRIALVNAMFLTPSSASREASTEMSAEVRRRVGDEIDTLTTHAGEALARTQRLVEAHKEVSDQIAHELRTPLMHLDTRLVRALSADPTPAIAERMIAVRGDIRRMVAMLEALLDIATSRARRGERHSLKRVDLSSLTRKLADLYTESALDNGHIFTHIIADGVIVQGEEMQLTRLVTNLLDNAFKYVPCGGRVTLSLAPGPVLSVVDNGPGIAPAMRDIVCDRFERGAQTQADEQGSGLGLALARAIAERHDLALTLEPSRTGAHFVLQRAVREA